MPKLRPAPKTLDQWVGALLETEMRQAGFTQESLAERAGMPTTNLGRSIGGVRPFTPSELMRLVGITGSARSAGELLDEAIARCDDLPPQRHGPRVRR